LVAGWTGRRLLAIGSAAVLASLGTAHAQQQREVDEGDLVRPEVRQEGPPLMVEPADQPREQNPEQLMTSLRRAQEALQLDDREAAMQELMQAQEQLDQTANARLDAEPWQRIDLAVQDAMKALAEDNPEYALIALERVTGPAQDSAAGGDRDGERQAGSVLDSMSADDILGAEVVDARGETIGEVTDIVRDRAGGGELYAILDVGGFLGIADKEVALALHRLQVAEDDRIVLPGMTESQLEELPTYDQADFEQLRQCAGGSVRSGNGGPERLGPARSQAAATSAILDCVAGCRACA
jgi:hypothetical protein